MQPPEYTCTHCGGSRTPGAEKSRKKVLTYSTYQLYLEVLKFGVCGILSVVTLEETKTATETNQNGLYRIVLR